MYTIIRALITGYGILKYVLLIVLNNCYCVYTYYTTMNYEYERYYNTVTLMIPVLSDSNIFVIAVQIKGLCVVGHVTAAARRR